jgi:hypothetical protein
MESFFSFSQLNLFSFVLGGIWGLSSYRWNPWKSWRWIVVYFAGVAFYYAWTSGAFRG